MTQPKLTILQGDCRAVLKTLHDESVQCCVTSPPYWGLRSYLPAGHPLKVLELGSERTPEEFITKMVAVFSEVRRVMRKDGTCWINMGDCYNGSGLSGGTAASDRGELVHRGAIGKGVINAGLKAKDLVGMPWRLALALQSDGWWLRSDIIWSKPNPMPESCSDRPTKSHEYIFLLTKSANYYYDAEAIAEPCSQSTHARVSQNVEAQIGSDRANGGEKTNGNMKAVTRKSWKGSSFDGDRERHPNVGKNRVKDNLSFNSALAIMPETRNKRTVWTVPTFSYSDAHFATFPPDLIRPCILAGSRPGDTVLDPFGGSGTVGQVSIEYGRSAILIELNPDYIPLIEQRTNITPGML